MCLASNFNFQTKTQKTHITTQVKKKINRKRFSNSEQAITKHTLHCNNVVCKAQWSTPKRNIQKWKNKMLLKHNYYYYSFFNIKIAINTSQGNFYTSAARSQAFVMAFLTFIILPFCFHTIY